MKKYMFILVVSAMVALTSCGSESTTTIESTDSTAVSVDTLSTTVKDTTVEVKTDSSDVK
jgi:ABC-type enterochelin transport system substrate-binding protein